MLNLDATAGPSLTPWGDLRCPVCADARPRLTYEGNWLRGSCGHRFPVRDGIPSLLPDEAERWEDGAETVPESRVPAELALSVVVPAPRTTTVAAGALGRLAEVIDDIGVPSEVIVVGDDETALRRITAPQRLMVRTLSIGGGGYGQAVRAGIEAARGRYVVTMDADLEHRPDFIRALWAHRESAEVVVASRYVRGGSTSMPWVRLLLSRLFNTVFSRGLALGVHDMSSGFRLMRTDVIRRLGLRADGFEITQEVLTRAHAQGWRILEVPCRYEARSRSVSRGRLVPFAAHYGRTFLGMWKVRNSIESADYDDRAFDSLIPLQRYWQRTRYRQVNELVQGFGAVLDVGCGSSRIIGSLPPGSVALDIVLPKLRYARRFARPVVHGSAFALPYADEAYTCVLCCEVIEHVPMDSPILDELCRVTARGGRLIIGTPDYDSRLWVALEAAYARVVPGGYADEHISHYTRTSLIDIMAARGFVLDDERDVLGADIMIAFRRES